MMLEDDVNRDDFDWLLLIVPAYAHFHTNYLPANISIFT